jgi:hypothetical protein
VSSSSHEVSDAS